MLPFHPTKEMRYFQGDKENYFVDLKDEVVRGSIILNQGELMWPPPRPAAPAPTAAKTEKAKETANVVVAEETPFAKTMKSALTYGMGG